MPAASVAHDEPEADDTSPRPIEPSRQDDARDDLAVAEADLPEQSELADLIRADLERHTGRTQVTLGGEDDYAAWNDPALVDLSGTSVSSAGRAERFDTLALPESSLSESPLTATASRTDERTEAAAEPRITTASVAPEWSTEWQAWIYRDDETDRLFRHDQDTNRWVPIS